MFSVFRLFYLLLLQPLALFLVLFIGQFISKKLKDGLSLRINNKYPQLKKDLQIVWIHCSSGEYEYAKSLVRSLKQNHPEKKILVTYFSPSYLKALQADTNIDFLHPLPLDLPGPLRTFLKTFKPEICLIARTDLWPECLYQCRLHKIPYMIVRLLSTAS